MTIIEYWNLIDQETFLAITWDTDFSRAWSFCRMLMNHKNFHFTQIPDKNNNVIFLKSPKTMLLGHFWTFLVISAQWGFFPKNPAVTNNYIWAPNTMLSFRKNSWTNPKKTYGQTAGWAEGQTNGQALFHRTLTAKARAPKRWNEECQ